MEDIHTKKRRPQPTISRPKKAKTEAIVSTATLLKRYALLLGQYQEAEITYQSHLFVRKIANTGPPQHRSRTLLPLFYATAKAFQMNELELTVWSLYLSRVVWQHSTDQLEKWLSFAALAAKEFFESDSDVYRAYLSNRSTSFDADYTNWRTSCRASLDVSPTELRDRFQTLYDTPLETVHAEAPDYNQLILAILEMSPPLQSSQFEEEIFKHLPSPPVLSLQDDRKSGATAPSCSPSDAGSALEGEEEDFWEANSSLPRIGSLSEIWPELSPGKEQKEWAS
jgi:hypothetical protein